MVFTKKHYISVCKIIRKYPSETSMGLFDDFVELFKKDNPKFSKNMFLDCVFLGKK